jgi:hypothetical protein
MLFPPGSNYLFKNSLYHEGLEIKGRKEKKLRLVLQSPLSLHTELS